MEIQNAVSWDDVRLAVLAEAYMEVRSEMWRILGARVGEKWQLVEQKCMQKGLKNLTQAHRHAQRKQGIYDTHHADSGVGISDVDEDPNEDPSPVLIDTPSQKLLANQQLNPEQFKVSSVHYIHQRPKEHQPIVYTSPDAPPPMTQGTIRGPSSSITKNSPAEKQEEQVHETEPGRFRKMSDSLSCDASADVHDVSTPSIMSEQETDFDMNEVDAQKELLLDRFMLHVYDIFDAKSSPSRRHQGSSNSSTGSPPKHTPSTSTNSRGTTKHHRTLDDDGNDQNQEDRPNKKPRKVEKPGMSYQEGNKKPFACPFFKHDPKRYCTARACAGPAGWENAARLKAPEGCFIRAQDPLEGLTKKQIEQLKHRRSMFRAGSEEEKWKIIYLICFPDTALDALPKDNRGDSPKDPTLTQYEAYMNRELPRKVRKELEIAIEKLVGPLEETLKNQLEGLIRNCQERLSRDFEQSRMSAENQPPDASSEKEKEEQMTLVVADLWHGKRCALLEQQQGDVAEAQ
ncbi:NAD-dependent protein deacylase SIR2rp2 [Kalmusia sp. IMI 367209]|nr:NAD-dependent protein deacylase SIR2rp2 [Kalmusia sp. IMI 367209]